MLALTTVLALVLRHVVGNAVDFESAEPIKVRRLSTTISGIHLDTNELCSKCQIEQEITMHGAVAFAVSKYRMLDSW